MPRQVEPIARHSKYVFFSFVCPPSPTPPRFTMNTTITTTSTTFICAHNTTTTTYLFFPLPFLLLNPSAKMFLIKPKKQPPPLIMNCNHNNHSLHWHILLVLFQYVFQSPLIPTLPKCGLFLIEPSCLLRTPAWPPNLESQSTLFSNLTILSNMTKFLVSILTCAKWFSPSYRWPLCPPNLSTRRRMLKYIKKNWKNTNKN